MTPLAAALRDRPDAHTPAVGAVVADLEARYGTGGEPAAFVAPVWLAYNRVLTAAVALEAATADRPEAAGVANAAVELMLRLRPLIEVEPVAVGSSGDLDPTPTEDHAP